MILFPIARTSTRFWSDDLVLPKHQKDAHSRWTMGPQKSFDFQEKVAADESIPLKEHYPNLISVNDLFLE